jgi:hypothetical protein
MKSDHLPRQARDTYKNLPRQARDTYKENIDIREMFFPSVQRSVRCRRQTRTRPRRGWSITRSLAGSRTSRQCYCRTKSLRRVPPRFSRKISTSRWRRRRYQRIQRCISLAFVCPEPVWANHVVSHKETEQKRPLCVFLRSQSRPLQ